MEQKVGENAGNRADKERRKGVGGEDSERENFPAK